MKIIRQPFLLIFALTSMQSHMICMERQKWDLTINPYKNDLLTALYDSSNGSSRLYIPEEDLTDLNELKKIFTDNNIRTVGIFSNEPWSESSWNRTYKEFKEASYEIFNTDKTFYTLDELQKILAKAKEVAKSFLPVEKNVSFITETPNDYIKKHSIRRLFTYAKLQQVIAEKNLTHIRLPIKFLFIKDKQTNQYVSAQKALSLIDDIFKICMIDTQFTIEPISDRYSIDIFAKREVKEGKGFSRATMEELMILCKEAPFDIGYDNIFWNAKGNAVIIDTEHKNESAKDCANLKKYPVDESLPAAVDEELSTIEVEVNTHKPEISQPTPINIKQTVTIYDRIASMLHNLKKWLLKKSTLQ